jgi:hypothetical protein
MKLKSSEIIIILLFTGLFIFSIISFFFVPQKLPIIGSAWKQSSVQIDGEITNSSEWQDSISVRIESKSILYIKNDNNSLYICLDAIGDQTFDDGDFFRIHFDTDNDNVWTPGEEDAFAYYSGLFSGGTHYIENVTGYANDYIYHCTFTCEPRLKGATSYSTSPNLNQLHQIYEMQIPLSLIDVNPGDQIGLFIYAGPFDASALIKYTIYPSDGDPFDMTTWLKLDIVEEGEIKSTNITFPWNILFLTFIIISLISIGFILFYRYYYKEGTSKIKKR